MNSDFGMSFCRASRARLATVPPAADTAHPKTSAKPNAAMRFICLSPFLLFSANIATPRTRRKCTVFRHARASKKIPFRKKGEILKR